MASSSNFDPEDLITADGVTHIETACTLRESSAPITDASVFLTSEDGNLLTDDLGNDPTVLTA